MNKKFKFLIKTAAVATIAVHVTNRIMNHISTSRDILSSQQGHKFPWKEGNIFYTKNGQGEPLLLIHDLYPDSSSYEWKQVIQELSHDYTVYAIDLLGCGRSAKPSIQYTNYLYVQLIQDFIKHVIKHPARLVVSKSSASFGILTSCMNSDSIVHLILVNPDSITKINELPSKREKLRKHLLHLPIFGTFIYNLDMQHAIEKLKFRLRFIGQTNPHPEDWAWAYTESAYIGKSQGKHLLSSIENKYISANIAHALKILKTPTTILFSSDHENIDETLDQYTKLNPTIHVNKIAHSRYLPQIDRPKQFCDSIRSIK